MMETRNFGNVCDMKLKEAEKTIANKDVIIKMLQNQVKKLEESYKGNLREREDFRYKFYMANEQINRIRNHRTHRDRRKDKEMKELLASSEHSLELNSKCCFGQKIKSVEKMMKAHYELLQALVEKVVDQNSVKAISSEEDTDSQITELQQEIDRLKLENAKLKEQNSDESILSIGDSLLEEFRRTTVELQKKVSSLMQKDEDDYSEEEIPIRSVSFSGQKVHSTKSSLISFGLTVIHEQRVDEENAKLSVSVQASEEFYCQKRPIEESTGENRKRDAFVQTEENKTGKEEIVTNKCHDNASTSSQLDAFSKKLDDIWAKINHLVEKQADTCAKLDHLMNDMSVSRETVQTCCGSISKLYQIMDEQNVSFLSNFQDHRLVSDSLIQMNDKIQQELGELKSQVAVLFNNVNNFRVESEFLAPFSQESKIVENERKIATAQKHWPPPMEKLTQLENQYDDLLKKCEEKDKRIENINAFISYYSRASKEMASVSETRNLKVEKEAKVGNSDEIHHYLEQVKSENLKLKSTISSVIDHLNVKINEEGKYKEDVISEENTSNNLLSIVDCCRRSQTSSLVDDQQKENNADMSLDIEDIYNIVRRSYAKSSSYSCVCNVVNLESSMACCKGSVKSSLCEYDSFSENMSVSIPSYTQSQYSEYSSNVDVEEKDLCRQVQKRNKTIKQNQLLAADLQKYVKHLEEQLEIVSDIESRIGSVQVDVDSPRSE